MKLYYCIIHNKRTFESALIILLTNLVEMKPQDAIYFENLWSLPIVIMYTYDHE